MYRPQLILQSLFFLSGFSSILYQVIWQRFLAGLSGADSVSVSIIISAFMLGLGLGSYCGGRLADRISSEQCVKAFGLAECVIGIFALLAPGLFVALNQEPLSGAALLVQLFVLLLIPTSLMGASLPLLAKGVVQDLNSAARQITQLYTVNIIGAALGAASMFVLPRYLGFDGATLCAAFTSAACGVSALLLPQIKLGTSPRSEIKASVGRSSFSPLVWCSLFGISGFMVMACEMLWFRELEVLLKGTTYTFALLLFYVLSSLGIGTRVGTDVLNTLQNPERVVLLALSFVGIYPLLSLLLRYQILGSLSDSSPLIAYLQKGEPTFLQGTSLTSILFLLLPAVVIVPPCFLSGFSYPILQRLVQNDISRVGHLVGVMQFANIIGATLGPLTVTFICWPLFGTLGAYTLIASLVVFYAYCLFRIQAKNLAVFLPATSLFLVFMLPENSVLWRTLHGFSGQEVVVEEGRSGVVAVSNADGTKKESRLYANGKLHSWFPYSGIHSALGAIPVFVHTDPKKVLIIGLGSGDTLYAASLRTAVEALYAVEIVDAMFPALQKLSKSTRYEGLDRLLADERVRHVVADGRNYLRRRNERFDIIQADASRPRSAYAGYLYSIEFFSLLRSRLTERGIAVTWAPTKRTTRTFCSVFPHVLSFYDGQILLGSLQAFSFDLKVLKLRIQQRFEREAGNTRMLLGQILDNLEHSAHSRTCPTESTEDVNTDWFPKDELGR